jgi:hypothetical protein
MMEGPVLFHVISTQFTRSVYYTLSAMKRFDLTRLDLVLPMLSFIAASSDKKKGASFSYDVRSDDFPLAGVTIDHKTLTLQVHFSSNTNALSCSHSAGIYSR